MWKTNGMLKINGACFVHASTQRGTIHLIVCVLLLAIVVADNRTSIWFLLRKCQWISPLNRIRLVLSNNDRNKIVSDSMIE